MDYSKGLADDDFKFAFVFLEKNHRGADLVLLKRAYLKSWMISPDGTMATEKVIQAGVKMLDELVPVAPVDNDPLTKVVQSDLLDE